MFITKAGHLIEQEQATDIVRKLLDNIATYVLLKNNLCDNLVKCFAID
jgi:hypothetical protein